MNTKRLAVIILNWNAAAETIACVKSIQKWRGLMPEIYVVDNHSSETDKQLLCSGDYGFKLISNCYNAGYAGGNNIGVKTALKDAHQTVFLLNNDARITEHDVSLLMESLFSSSDIGVVGPLVYDKHNRTIQNAGGKDIGWHYISHLKSIPSKNNIYDVDYVSGTAIMIKTKVFQQIELLDERYFFSGEVADFCRRIRKFKFQNGSRWRVVINPRARVFHDLSVSSHHRESLYTYYTVRNRFLYIRKFLLIYAPVLYSYWCYKHLQHALLCYKMGRIDIVRVILRGVLHGLVGRYGPLIKSGRLNNPK